MTDEEFKKMKDSLYEIEFNKIRLTIREVELQIELLEKLYKEEQNNEN